MFESADTSSGSNYHEEDTVRHSRPFLCILGASLLGWTLKKLNKEPRRKMSFRLAKPLTFTLILLISVVAGSLFPASGQAQSATVSNIYKWNILHQNTNSTMQVTKVRRLDATHTWMVGKGGLISFYNGIRWLYQPSGTTKDLLDNSISNRKKQTFPRKFRQGYAS